MRRRVVPIALTILCAVGGYACLTDLLNGPGVRDVVVSHTDDSIIVSGDSRPRAFAASVGGSPLAEPRFSYTSSNPAIVSVDSASGVMAAHLRGRVTVTARLVTSILPDMAPRDSLQLRVVAKKVVLDRSSV